MKQTYIISQYLWAGIACVVLLLETQSVSAQWRLKGPFNRVSVEVQGGISDVPLHPSPENGNIGDFTTYLGSYQVGIRYMFNDLIGVRPVYGFHSFRGSSDQDPQLQLKIRRVGIDGVLNLAGILPAGNFRNLRKWNLLLHGGGSYAFGYLGKKQTRSDNLLIGSLGGTLQYRLFPNIAVFADLSGHGSVRQNYGYDEQKIPSGEFPTAMFVTGSVGIQYYLGRHAHHMDWK